MSPTAGVRTGRPAGHRAGARRRTGSVGADYPPQPLLGGVEVGPDRGQRHVDDRHVEHDHELLVARAGRLKTPQTWSSSSAAASSALPTWPARALGDEPGAGAG